jgi:ribosomal protein S13
MLSFNFKNLISQFFGINLHLLYKSMAACGLSFKKLYIKNNMLNICIQDYNNIISYIDSSFLINALLKDKIFINIRKLKLLKGYKGSRHIYNLPVHGQRTKTNAKTCKKKKKKIKNVSNTIL